MFREPGQPAAAISCLPPSPGRDHVALADLIAHQHEPGDQSADGAEHPADDITLVAGREARPAAALTYTRRADDPFDGTLHRAVGRRLDPDIDLIEFVARPALGQRPKKRCRISIACEQNPEPREQRRVVAARLRGHMRWPIKEFVRLYD